MLKADLHLHCKGDPYDTHIKYSWKQVINRAAKHNFQVLSFTLHDRILYIKEMIDYAKKKNILLIPGIEVSIKEKHILIYNITEQQRTKIKSFKDLEKLKNQGAVIIAAHPFLPMKEALKNQTFRYMNLFHGLEINHFYQSWLHPQRKTIRIAKKHNKTLIGTSDLHNLWTMNYTYTFIDAQKTKESVLNALKSRKTKLVSKPLPFILFCLESVHIIKELIKGKIKNFLYSR